MLYKPQPGSGELAPLESAPRPQDTDSAVEAIQSLLSREDEIVARIIGRAAPAAAPVATPAAAQAALSPQAQTEPQAGPAPELAVHRHTLASEDVSEDPHEDAAMHPSASQPRARRAFRPDWRLTAAILMLAVALYSPAALVVLVVGVPVGGLLLCVVLSTPWAHDALDSWHGRMQAQTPARAVRLGLAGNRLLALLDRALSRLPDVVARRLDLPVFDTDVTAQQPLPDPFDRLMPQERL